MNQRTRIKRAAAVRRSRRAHVVKQQITTINRAFQKLQRKFKNINVATAKCADSMRAFIQASCTAFREL